MRYMKSVFIVIMLLSILQSGCGNDNSTQPLATGAITGEITFVGTQKPDGDIKVRLWRNWPPTGNPVVNADIANANGIQAYKFENVPLGTYQAVTFDWLVPDDLSQNRIIGVYWADRDSVGTAGTLPLPVQPKAIEITSDNPTANNIDIKADHGIVQ